MKISYLDCSSGISGDMTLGALVDAGADLAAIQEGIDSLGLPQCRLRPEEVKRCGFRGLRIHVEHAPEQAHRHLHHITRMIDGSRLTPRQKGLANRIFSRLAEAEARVHGTSIEKVHFHEVGAVDSIADIVGAAIGFDLLGADRVVCSPIPAGSGHVQIAHGRVAVPAPATAELLRGIPLASSVVEAELTTPTGAAIAATLADEFGSLPPMRIASIGYGAGSREFREQPNLMRLIVGETDTGLLSDEIWILETNLDDVTGEVVAYCTSRLLEAGALDVYTTPIHMKKNRPGIKLTVLCDQPQILELEALMLSETTALGVRRWAASRHKLKRDPGQVDTRWGKIEGKLATLGDGSVRFSPEYESCRKIAIAQGVPLQEVYDEARRRFAERSGGSGRPVAPQGIDSGEQGTSPAN